MELTFDIRNGTHVLGSSFGRLLTTYRDREADSYPFETIGYLRFLKDGWLIVECDPEIARYYVAHLKTRFGVEVGYRPRAGTHVSVIRGEQLQQNAHRWGELEGLPVTIRYTHHLFTNGLHWWLNVNCDELAPVRGFYGLGTDKRFFHLTVGRK